MEYYKNLSLEDLFYINDDGLVCCEEWRDVVGYESLYHNSNLGRIKSLNRMAICMGGYRTVSERILKQQKDKDGYLTIHLSSNNVKSLLKVHRLIGIAFIPNPLNLPEINHKGKDGDKTDNRVCSLEWNTSKQNKEFSIKNNMNARGEKQAKSKLTEKDVLEIRSSSLNQYQLCEIYNVTRPAIGYVLRRVTWKHI